MENSLPNRRRKSNLEKLLEETPEAYYWMGFLVADGSFSKDGDVKLHLSEKDSRQVEKFAEFINYTGESKYPCVRVRNVVVARLIREKFSIELRKTYNPIKTLPEEDDLFLAFLIGLIDGDGCVYRVNGKRPDSAIAIKCHHSWLPTLINIHRRVAAMSLTEGSPEPHLVSGNRYAILTWSNTKVVRFLKSQTQRLCLPVLERKWDIIDDNYISGRETALFRVAETKRLLQEGKRVKDIALLLGVTDSAISLMIKRKKLRI